MEEQLNQDQNQNLNPQPQPEVGKNKFLFLTSGLIAVLTLLLVTAGYKYFNDNQAVLGKNDTKKAKVTHTKAKTASSSKRVEIKTVKDLEKYIKEIESYNTSSMESDLQASVKESSEL